MKKFIDLLTEKSRLPSGEHQNWVSSQIEMMLPRGQLQVWHLGEPIRKSGTRILIGIAAWSGYDLRLLDALTQAFTGRPDLQELVDILDIDVASRASGGWDYFEWTFPSMGKVYQTPLAAIWEDGILMQKGSGAAGRDLIIDRYKLRRDQMAAIPNAQ